MAKPSEPANPTDPNELYKEIKFFHNITSEQSHQLLKLAPVGSFLIRPATAQNSLTLCFVGEDKIEKKTIIHKNDVWIYKETELSTLGEILEKYFPQQCRTPVLPKYDFTPDKGKGDSEGHYAMTPSENSYAFTPADLPEDSIKKKEKKNKREKAPSGKKDKKR